MHPSLAPQLSFGGSGGDGGSAGDVTFAVPDSLTIRTGNLDTGAGSGSHGIFLQSIGGGGGHGSSSPAMSTTASNTDFTLADLLLLVALVVVVAMQDSSPRLLLPNR